MQQGVQEMEWLLSVEHASESISWLSVSSCVYKLHIEVVQKASTVPACHYQKCTNKISQNKNVIHPRDLTLRAADCPCIPIPPFHGLKLSARLLG
jgi:hypothetical protein